MANVLTRLGGRKRSLVSYSHAMTLFLLMTKTICAAGRRVPLGD